MRLRLPMLAAVAAAGLWAGSAQAVLISLPEFTGASSQSFESFPNYADQGGALPQPATVIFGEARVSAAHSDLKVYQPGVAIFGLGGFGFAPVAQGIKGLALDSGSDTGTITFVNRSNAVGGYWGAASPTISFRFYDGATEVGSTSLTYAGGGSLAWAGWFSTVPFDSFTYSGDYVVVDNLQSDAAPVPEPASAMALLLGTALLGIRRCRA